MNTHARVEREHREREAVAVIVSPCVKSGSPARRLRTSSPSRHESGWLANFNSTVTPRKCNYTSRAIVSCERASERTGSRGIRDFLQMSGEHARCARRRAMCVGFVLLQALTKSAAVNRWTMVDKIIDENWINRINSWISLLERDLQRALVRIVSWRAATRIESLLKNFIWDEENDSRVASIPYVHDTYVCHYRYTTHEYYTYYTYDRPIVDHRDPIWIRESHPRLSELDSELWNTRIIARRSDFFDSPFSFPETLSNSPCRARVSAPSLSLARVRSGTPPRMLRRPNEYADK